MWLLAAPAAVSIWAGWVGLGDLTGFGEVRLLPGIWDSAVINTAVTLPIGMEAYAAYGLYCWLHPLTPRRAREFAGVSAIGALLIGALGQVTYHLLAAAGVEAAPWLITALVSCLPVGVLGLGATLAHLLQDDDTPAEATRPVAEQRPAEPAPNLAQPYRTVAPPRPMPTAVPTTQPVAEQPVAEAVAGARPTGWPTVRPAAERAAAPQPERPHLRPVQSPTRRPEPAAPKRPRPGVPADVRKVADLLAEAERKGEQPPGARTVAKALGVSRYQAGKLLDQAKHHTEKQGEVQ